MSKQINSFYKYTVKWYEAYYDYKLCEESGYTVAPTYGEAARKVGEHYGDDNIAYIHLVCLNDCDVINEKDFQTAINEKI